MYTNAALRDGHVLMAISHSTVICPSTILLRSHFGRHLLERYHAISIHFRDNQHCFQSGLSRTQDAVSMDAYDLLYLFLADAKKRGDTVGPISS